MPEHIDEAEFTIFDTETTGLNPGCGDRVVELAGLRVKGNKEIGKFETLLNPGREISPGAFAVNKITGEMLKDAPGAQTAIPDFIEFSRGSFLCSYNIEFDLGFLNSELRIIGRPELESSGCFDILGMARFLLPGQPRYSLWFIASRLGVESAQKHRAFSDVEMTWRVFARLKDICAARGIKDFADFSRTFSPGHGRKPQRIEPKITRIEMAIRSGSLVKIKYVSVKDSKVTLREVVPKEIREGDSGSYLVGFCCMKQEECRFKIDNIMELEII
ncbi:MAG: exonuclease domain-containing protein [Candidatus Omnitrophota bacterium]